MMWNSRNIAILILAIASNLAGCSPASTTLSKGMNMQDAVDAMNKRGLDHGEMDMIGGTAFTLPDGRVLILSGGNSVDDIVIVSPWESKVMREFKSIDRIEF